MLVAFLLVASALVGPASAETTQGEASVVASVPPDAGSMSEHQPEAIEEEPGPLAYVFVAIMLVFLAGLVTTAAYLFYRAAREEF